MKEELEKQEKSEKQKRETFLSFGDKREKMKIKKNTSARNLINKKARGPINHFKTSSLGNYFQKSRKDV